MSTEPVELTPKKQNLYSHARTKRVSEDILSAQSSICSLTIDDLRLVGVQYVAFLKKKVFYHRAHRGTFHAERASAFDAALQEFTQLLQDVND